MAALIHAFWIQLLTALALQSNMNSKNLFQQYIKQLWLQLSQSIFKIHKIKWHHFSVRTKKSRVQKKREQAASKGKVASHKFSPVFSPNERATTEVILVQHPLYRTLHPKRENILLPQTSLFTTNFLIASVAWLAQVKKWREWVSKSPVLTQ